jgi:hypothetical protein
MMTHLLQWERPTTKSSTVNHGNSSRIRNTSQPGTAHRAASVYMQKRTYAAMVDLTALRILEAPGVKVAY